MTWSYIYVRDLCHGRTYCIPLAIWLTAPPGHIIRAHVRGCHLEIL